MVFQSLQVHLGLGEIDTQDCNHAIGYALTFNLFFHDRRTVSLLFDYISVAVLDVLLFIATLNFGCFDKGVVEVYYSLYFF